MASLTERMPSTILETRFDVEMIKEPVAVMKSAGVSMAERAACDDEGIRFSIGFECFPSK